MGELVDGTLRAIEVEGTVDEQHRLHVEEPLPVDGPGRVRVLVLIPDVPGPEDQEWLRAAASNPAFDFLKHEEEDIYSLADGRPFIDQG